MLEASHYDSILEGEPPQPCPVCTGDMTAEPCGEECDELIRACERKTRIKSLYVAARGAMWWARTYACRREAYQVDARVLACVDMVQKYRGQIRLLRRAWMVRRLEQQVWARKGVHT